MESTFVIFDHWNLLSLIIAIVHPLMLLNVNTHVNSVIESLYASMKFMEILMNVYLPYSLNCWRKWMYILLRAWPSVALLVDQFKKRIANISNTTIFIFTNIQVWCFNNNKRMVQYLEPRLGVRLNYLTSGTYVFVSNTPTQTQTGFYTWT